jgi:hypothetical protein
MIRSSRYRLYNVAAHNLVSPSSPLRSIEEVAPAEDGAPPSNGDEATVPPDLDDEATRSLRAGD